MTAYPFVQAKHFHVGRQNKRVLWLVVHTAETAEMGDSAEAVQRYFATTDREASAHLCGDSNSIVRSVLDKDTAFAAKSANNQGLHFEFAGRAAQTASQWADDYSTTELVLAAQAFATWAREHGIPLRFVDAAGLKRGDAGITTHAEISNAWPSTGHTDPGPNFPMGHFIDLVRAAYGSSATAVPATTTPPSPPVPAKPKETDVLVLIKRDGGSAVFATNGVTRRWVSTGDRLANLQRWMEARNIPSDVEAWAALDVDDIPLVGAVPTNGET